MLEPTQSKNQGTARVPADNQGEQVLRKNASGTKFGYLRFVGHDLGQGAASPNYRREGEEVRARGRR